MKEPVWVLDSVVKMIHQMQIAEHGGTSGIRDEALLESALAKSRQNFNYKTEVTIFELAASYSYGLAKNHPFADGNKRIAFTIAALFLELNSYLFDAPEAEVVVFFEGLASAEITEFQLAQWIKDSSIKQ